MPRTADHDARRRQIADAACSIVAGHGLDAASVARVAAQAGVSVGLVQHYFPSKDAMLLFAYQQVMTDLDARVAARIVEGEAQQPTISAMVLSSLCELLPIDDLRQGEYRVTRAFHGRALDNDALAEVARTTSADIRARLAVAVANGKECGEVADGVDAELAATRMTALVSGLAEQLHLDRRRSVGPMDLSAAAKVLLRSCLDDVFTGECRRHG